MAHTHKQTEIYHTANGSTTSFSYPFEYYQKSDVHVTVNGTAKTQGTHYDVTGTNVVFKTSPSDYTPANNDVIRVYRDTDVNTSKATFAAGSSIRATDLNNNETQLLFSAQEQVDQEIVTADIRDGQITSAKIKDGAVTADQIGANALTYAKIQNVSATNRILGRDSSGAGIIEEITPANLRTMINVEDGATGDQTNDEIRQAIGNASDSNIFTDADHTKLDGIAAGAEVNVQSDWNSTSGDNFIVNKPTIPAAQVQSDWNATSGMGEILNKPTIPELIDEDDFSTNSATKAPSQQSTKAYVDSRPLDEDNFSTDSATRPPTQQSTKAYIAATSQPLDGDLTTLAGMHSSTASILAANTALTSDIGELNMLDGKSIVTSVGGSSTDVQLPTAKAVNDAIAASAIDAGNYVPIADINSFPESNPDPGGNAGTIVSIADAGGLVVNSSGVATNADSITSDATITINGIDTSLRSTTIAAGKGMLVQTTSTTHTYDYHRLVVDEAGVASAQTLVSDFNDRYQVTTDSTAPTSHPDSSALQEGDLWFDGGANTMKVYDGSNYAAVTSVGDYKLLTVVPAGATSGTPDYSNTTFDLRDGSSAANVTSAGQLIISVNGVIQKPNAGTSQPAEGFALVDSNTIIFGAAPGSGASVFVTLIGSATSVNVPADNSVARAKIQNLAVDNSKIANDTIDEGKLNIHNDPSGTDKYLKYTSNGMEWVTVAQYTTPLTTRGDILFRDASGDQRLAKGTAGQFLKIGANDPEWADISTTTIPVADESTDTSCNVVFVTDPTGDQAPKTGTNLTFDSSGAGVLTTGTFAGALTGTASQATSAVTTVNVNLTDESSDTSCYPIFATGDTGTLPPKTGSNLTFNSSSGALSATSFVGDGSALTGIASTVLDGCGYENDDEISAGTYSIASGKGVNSVGPITNNGTVTVNGRWVIH